MVGFSSRAATGNDGNPNHNRKSGMFAHDDDDANNSKFCPRDKKGREGTVSFELGREKTKS